MKTRVVQNQKSTEKQFFYIIGCMSHPEKATSCYLGNYWLLRLDYEDKNCFEPKKVNKNSFFYLRLFKSSRNKATLSCYLRNYRVLRLNSADKSCLETKINWKIFILHQMLYGSSRKSYIIMLSAKFRLLRLYYEHKNCLESKINWKKLIFNIGCKSHPEKAT